MARAACSGSAPWTSACCGPPARGVHRCARRISERLLVGTRCWQLVWPGLLTAAGVGDPCLTLYAGERPWVVLGELEDGQLLAAP